MLDHARRDVAFRAANRRRRNVSHGVRGGLRPPARSGSPCGSRARGVPARVRCIRRGDARPAPRWPPTFANGGVVAWVVRTGPGTGWKRGIRALDAIPGGALNLLCLPGASGLPSTRHKDVVDTALRLCERHRAFIVLDPPSFVADAGAMALYRNGSSFPELSPTAQSSSRASRSPPAGSDRAEPWPGDTRLSMRAAACGRRLPGSTLPSTVQRSRWSQARAESSAPERHGR